MSTRDRQATEGLLAAIVGAGALAASGQGQTPFTEEAVARGLEYVVGDPMPMFGRGLAAVDLDGDGDPDVVAVGAADGIVGVFENLGGGSFANRTPATSIPWLPTASGVVAGDYDGDGDLDLYITCWETPNVLLRNDGAFRFVDATALVGLGDSGPGVGCAWADYDGDGWLDLYVGNYLDTNLLYHNLGHGTFVEMAASAGVNDGASPTFQPAFFDYDRDGDADLYLSTDKGYTFPTTGYRNRLLENTGGRFVEVTEASGTGGYINSMGVAVGDFDHDGLGDLYCTNTSPGNLLLLNRDDATFREFTAPAGVASFAIGWAALFLDYDNDADADLYVCNCSDANRLYARPPRWPAPDLAPALDVADPGMSFCLAAADVDDDGDLDLLVSNGMENLRLYINHEGEKRNWLKVRLRRPGPNVHGVGARVEVVTGSRRQHRELLAGSGYKSSSPMVLHFGLGGAVVADEVRVRWPGGGSTILSDVAANRTLVIVREASPGGSAPPTRP